MLKKILKWFVISSFIALIVALLLYVGLEWQQSQTLEKNKITQLKDLESFEQQGYYELSELVLSRLLELHSQDPEVQRWIVTIQDRKKRFQEESRRIADEKELKNQEVLQNWNLHIQTLENEVATLKGGVKGFQGRLTHQYNQIKNRLSSLEDKDKNGALKKADYYFLITGKQIKHPEFVNETAIKKDLQTAEENISQQKWQNVSTLALAILSQDPSSEAAFVLWAYSMVCQAPESHFVWVNVLPLMEKALKGIPRDRRLLLALGRVYRAKSQWQQAQEMLTKAYEITPAQQDVRLDLGLLGLAKKDFQMAVLWLLPLWKEGVRTDEMGIRISLAREGALYFESVDEFFDQWLTISKAQNLVYFHKGVWKQKVNDRNEALACFQKSIYYKPSFDAWDSVAQVQNQLEQFSLAADAYREALNFINLALAGSKNEYVQIASMMCHLYFQAKQYDRVIQEGLKIWKLDDNNPERDMIALEILQSYQELKQWKQLVQDGKQFSHSASLLLLKEKMLALIKDVEEKKL